VGIRNLEKEAFMESYGRRIVLDMPIAAALTALTGALARQGFTVLGRVDVRDYIDRTLHSDFRRYELLEVAVPAIVHDALCEDISIGALLPTAVAVFELADGETAVSVAEPFGGLASRPGWRQSAAPRLAAVVDDTCHRLAVALEELQRGTERDVAITRRAPLSAR
jgi:uncharacterized protein (DUF302 family)